MATQVTTNDIVKYAIQLLKRYRCGFDNCVAQIDYFPMSDDLRFAAQGNITLIYNFGREPRYDEFLKSLAVMKWIDPIC